MEKYQIKIYKIAHEEGEMYILTIKSRKVKKILKS
jgi:hypothetical protein